MSTQRDRPARLTPANGQPPGPACRARHGTAMHLLACGVPLSLIMDLAAPGGPPSREILTVEGSADDSWWEPS
jgi:hypothetical protein